MRVEDLEPELEALLLRLAPTLAYEWQGAPEDDIAKLEKIAGRPLPRVYAWFLRRMGRSMGPLRFIETDFSLETILAAYADPDDSPNCDGGELLIAYETGSHHPLHLFYDFDHPGEGDYRVSQMELGGGPIFPFYGGLKEMLASVQFSIRGIPRFMSYCEGWLGDDGRLVAERLDEILPPLSLVPPVRFGPTLRIFERDDLVIQSSCRPNQAGDRHFFEIGAKDEASIRRLLGELGVEGGLTVEVESWETPR